MKLFRKVLICTAVIILCMSFAGCGSGGGSVDKASFDKIAGDYQAVGEESWWHLYIGKNDESGNQELSIYDNEAGNPGVEGEIISLDDESVTIKIDQELYDQLPSGDWKDSGENLEMTYEVTDKGIILTNNNAGVEFKKD